jgi:pimeloyl-ACP methyl ester carboxylesterase
VKEASVAITTDHDTLHSMDVQGTTVEYVDHGGNGEPVLLVHAGAFGAWFEPLAAGPTLEGRRVIRMLRAGYTGGPAPAGHLSIADHARHAATLLDTLGAAPAHVVAHSSGSVIALQLALDRPELVRSLILSEPPLLDSLAAPEDLEFLHTQLGPVIGGAIAAAAAGDVAASFEAFMGTVCGPDYQRVLTTALGAEALPRAEQDARFFFTDEIRAAAEWTFDEHSARLIQPPVLLVQGGASIPPVHRLIARLAALLPNAEVATIDDDNHLLPLRSPAALGHLVEEFTRRHSTGRDDQITESSSPSSSRGWTRPRTPTSAATSTTTSPSSTSRTTTR